MEGRMMLALLVCLALTEYGLGREIVSRGFPVCPAIGCVNPCPYGYVRDENGCPTCECKGPVCFLFACVNRCPFGYVRDERGCILPTCKCRKLKCLKKYCTVQYAPVCGSDGKTYGNLCFLNAADCKSEEDITLVHLGPCKPDCLQHCSYLKDPVCGSDGKTYPNECVLENADCVSEENITKVHDGNCKLRCRGIKRCTAHYAPVCGTDGKTYGNLCFLNVADCESEEDIRVAYSGPCKTGFCPAIACVNPCPFGYVYDENGCSTCKCKISALLKKLCQSRKVCSQEHSPVCGSDGKTYGNECFLKAADECDKDEEITIAHPGPCSG